MVVVVVLFEDINANKCFMNTKMRLKVVISKTRRLTYSTLMTPKGDCMYSNGKDTQWYQTFGFAYFCQGLSLSVGGRIASQSFDFLHFLQ